MRLVRPDDYDATRRLVVEAFRPEDVGKFLDALRADGCILDEWLAEDESGPVGHIAFSRVWVQYPDGVRLNAAILTPLGVRPNRQRIGIGTSLTTHALEALETRGERLFFVLGHPEYYPRFGFRPVTSAEIASPWSGNAAFMVRGNPPPNGTLVLPAAIADAH